MNSNLTIDYDQTEPETEIDRLSERIAELEQEKMLLEEVLRRNTRMFEAFLRNSNEGITLTGPDMRIVRVVKGLTGIDPDLLIGRLVDAAAVPGDRPAIVDAYRQLLEGRCGKIRIDIRLQRRDGIVGRITATLTDMLDDPDVQGIVWNYSAHPAQEPGPAAEIAPR